VGFAFFQELLFKTKPRSPGIDAVTLVNDVQEVGGDGVEELGDDHTVHARPHWIMEAGGVVEDVATPLGVVGGREV
jgi:hypothetical protein